MWFIGRYIQKKKKAGPNGVVEMGYARPKMVLTPFLEIKLRDNILRLAKTYYGLTPKEIRQRAYRLAVANGRKIPKNWHLSECASKDWYSGFIKRYFFPSLSLNAVLMIS